MEFPSKQAGLTHSSSGFEPCQIVCLEHETSRLYGEVVQVVEQRQVCWVRPLMLTVEGLDTDEPIDVERCFYDLRDSSDLLLPVALFRTALDIEVIPLFPYLHNQERIGSTFNPTGHQQLKQLVQRVWKAYPDMFQA